MLFYFQTPIMITDVLPRSFDTYLSCQYPYPREGIVVKLPHLTRDSPIRPRTTPRPGFPSQCPSGDRSQPFPCCSPIEEKSPAQKRPITSCFLRREIAEKWGISTPFWRITPPGAGKGGNPGPVRSRIPAACQRGYPPLVRGPG
jgi:hypothetical protein